MELHHLSLSSARWIQFTSSRSVLLRLIFTIYVQGFLPGREVDRSLMSSAEVRNKYLYFRCLRAWSGQGQLHLTLPYLYHTFLPIPYLSSLPVPYLCTYTINFLLSIGLPNGLFFSCFRNKTVYVFPIAHACYVFRPSHHTWLYRLICIRGEIQITKFHNTHFE